MLIIFVGVFFIALGLISLFFATKLKPNFLVGYRSKRANMSQDNYLVANRYAGKFMLVEGVVSLFLSYFARYIPYKYTAVSAVTYFIILATIMAFYTEGYLKKYIMETVDEEKPELS